VERAVAAQEAVLCALGTTKSTDAQACSRGTRNIVEAMKRCEVRRLVCVTGAMIGHPRERLGWLYRLLLGLMPRSARALIEDRREQERIVQQSGLDWTLVRPPLLTDRPGRGRWQAGEDLRIGAFAHISRADLAAFMLGQLGEERFLRRGVTIRA
jgi:putative NADH-flavin reductase